jgi:polysaccharide biosynthesis transport protein
LGLCCRAATEGRAGRKKSDIEAVIIFRDLVGEQDLLRVECEKMPVGSLSSRRKRSILEQLFLLYNERKPRCLAFVGRYWRHQCRRQRMLERAWRDNVVRVKAIGFENLMLRTNQTRPIVEHEAVLREEGGLGEMVNFARDFLRRQYPILLFCVPLAIVVGVIYLRTKVPTYVAHASMIIDMRKGLFLQQSILPDAPTDTAGVESQVQILKSEGVAISVIRNLHLTEVAEFVDTDDVSLFDRLHGFFLGLSSRPPRSEFDLMRQAIGVLEGRLEASRVGLSYVLDISFTSSNPDRAAQIANSVADAYIADQLDSKFQTHRRASDWLQERVNGLRDQATVAENVVVAFKRENNLVAVGGMLMNEQQIAELNTQLILARAHTSEAEARLNRIDAIVRVDSSNTRFDASVSDALNNPIITKLRQQYLELVNREADWSRRFGRDHLAVVNLRNQLREIRDSIFQELRRYSETYKSDYEIAKRRQKSLEADLAQAESQSQEANKARVTLRQLESSAQGFRTLHDSFRQRYTESIQQQSFPITEARVIWRATRPGVKSGPKPVLILALACFGGIGLGTGIGFIREVMDRVFRTTGQVEAALSAPCVALVPLVDDALGAESSNSEEALASAGSKFITRDGSVCWIVAEQPMSRFAEAIRSVKLAADLNIVDKRHKVIGFTSALPNEGKSTVAAALAQLAAQVGGKVIIVDCDLRNPSLSRTFAPKATIGIIDVLAGEYSLDDAIWRDGPEGMAFLPALSNSRVFHTSEVLASEPTKQLIYDLRESYDYVVVDLPPLAPLIDVRATSHLVDGYFLIIEWGRTKIDVVQHALNTAPGVYEGLLGAVLNKANMKYMVRYEAHRGKYYLNKHFARYGYTD